MSGFGRWALLNRDQDSPILLEKWYGGHYIEAPFPAPRCKMIPSDWLQSPIEDLDSLETTFQPGSSRPLAEWEEWRRFRAQMEPGDVVMPFSSAPESWAQLSGRAGYALVREEQVVAVLITRMN